MGFLRNVIDAGDYSSVGVTATIVEGGIVDFAAGVHGGVGYVSCLYSSVT